MSIDTRIELARKTDVASMLDLVNWAAENTVANFATRRESLDAWVQTWTRTCRFYPWLVARRADAVVGFARAMPHQARGAYHWSAEVSIYVDPALHGHGIATRLYRELIPLLTVQGYATLLASITDGNDASEQLHAKFGFTRVGTLHRVGWKFGRWHDVGYWELHVQHHCEAPRLVLPVLDVLPIPTTEGATDGLGIRNIR